MTLQNDLRMYAEDMHSCHGHSDCSTVMSLSADRIDELEKEVARLKTVPMKYRRMEFNAQLQKELEAKQARIDELEKRQVTEIANQMLNGWEEDQG